MVAYLYVNLNMNGTNYAVDEAYRTALDEANHQLGGADTRPEGGGYVVNGAEDNTEPLRLMDSSLTNMCFLVVDSLENANKAATVLSEITNGQLKSWIFDAKEPAVYR